MQIFLSCAVAASSAKKSCFIWLRSLTSAIQVCSTESAFLLNSYQRNHHAKCQNLKSSYFVAVEKKREVGRVSDFADHILSLQRVSFFISFQ